MAINLNNEVTTFLDDLHHPFRKEIEKLRSIILSVNNKFTENIKWNGPNYCYNKEDRITMRIQPPKQVQLIFHRGAIKKEQPQSTLINDNSGLLIWRGNDRAVITFNSMADIDSRKADLATIIKKWIHAAL